ncbi:tyrosine-type recombinase/integrase [Sutcliffiella horikoshii]|uniref:Tyrosine-type recombinase/integrase n=1 Tax=Sutcliffiella horikoshii TaxID=79883 RepID=A0A5D4T6V0_9BACI|nr:tyrosine-type recombinase/integrase [Sutcliffiella horikoshii]TYS71045.1 tyrosine-type recombinase/integrase [Sutcliffiella horikoshii]
MPIKIQSSVNYEGLCNELGITVDELLMLVKNKDKQQLNQPKVTAIQVIDEYHQNLNELHDLNRRSAETIKTYENFLKRLKTFLSNSYPNLIITELRENIVYELLKNSKARKTERLATNTVNKYLAIIRSILGFAHTKGYTDKDLRGKFPIQSIDTLPRYINDTHTEKVLKAALQKTYGYRKRAMLIFLLGTGCRVSELTNMKVCDFDINENLIFVRKGKRNKERYIPMFEEVKIKILHYLKLSGVDEWKSDIRGYLFSSDEGLIREKKILDRSVQYLVRGIFDDIGLDNNFTVHSLRHTFAVNCLKSGIIEPYLMQMLGHEDPKTTAVYTKLVPKDLREQVMKNYPFPFEQLLNELI